MPSVRTVVRRIPPAVSNLRWLTRAALAGARRRTEAGCVALTFDDGPHPVTTSRVLDVLGDLGVKATFFCVGRNAEAHPQIVRRALQEGHSLGSHSYSHPYPPALNARDLFRDYAAGRRAVSEAAGRDVRLFRPPHGQLPASGALRLRRQSMAVWLWSTDPQDWRPETTVEAITSVAGSAVTNDVILMHDWVEQPLSALALDRSATIDALPQVVKNLKDRGLRFIGLSG